MRNSYTFFNSIFVNTESDHLDTKDSYHLTPIIIAKSPTKLLTDVPVKIKTKQKKEPKFKSYTTCIKISYLARLTQTSQKSLTAHGN